MFLTTLFLNNFKLTEMLQEEQKELILSMQTHLLAALGHNLSKSRTVYFIHLCLAQT